MFRVFSPNEGDVVENRLSKVEVALQNLSHCTKDNSSKEKDNFIKLEKYSKDNHDLMIEIKQELEKDRLRQELTLNEKLSKSEKSIKEFLEKEYVSEKALSKELNSILIKGISGMFVAGLFLIGALAFVLKYMQNS